MSSSAKPFLPVLFSTSIQLSFFGCNTVLFVLAMWLLRKRNRHCPSTFHIVSTVILIVFATIAAVTQLLEASAMMGEWAGVNIEACSIVLNIANDIADVTAVIILIYRCYCVCYRSPKFIVLPALLLIISQGIWWSNVLEYSKGTFGANDVQLDKSFDPHINNRIWWFMRDSRLVSALPVRSDRQYSYTIAVVLESGLIIPVFLTIFTGLMLDGGAKWTVPLSIMGAMNPQISALAPLLIVVRIGLGQAVEENTSRLSGSRITGISNDHPTDSSNGNSCGPTFRATTRNEESVGEMVDITIGCTRASSDHDLRDKFEDGEIRSQEAKFL